MDNVSYGVFNRHLSVVKAFVAIASFVAAAVVGAADAKYLFATLDEAFKSAGYDPNGQSAATFAVCADLHVGKELNGLEPTLLKELNEMKPAPKFLVIAGDMITNASHSFGNVPNAAQKEKAVTEFQMLKESLKDLSPSIAVKMALGNHDTYPYEKDGALFRSVFTDHPVYGSFTEGGVHFMLLNGGQSGDIDAAQMEWMLKDLAAIPVDQAIVAFVHQPAVGRVVSERGIGLAVKKAFADRTGELWLIGGHGHGNSTSVFQLPKTKLAQVMVTTCNPKVWGDSEHPGYWIYGVDKGHVAVRVFRKLGVGYRVEPPPNSAKAAPIPEPFEKLDGILWKVMVGDGDKPYRVTCKAADVVTWWGYAKELVYRFPLAELKVNPARLAILAELGKKDKKDCSEVSISSDGKSWDPLDLPEPVNSVYLFSLPEKFRSGDLHLRIIGKGEGAVVAGFALCK